FTQFLKYKRTDPTRSWPSTLASFPFASVLSAIIVYFTQTYTNVMYSLLTSACVFCLLANMRVLGDALKGKWRLAGSAVAHIGFALLLLGALIAAATNEVISINESRYIQVQNFGQDGDKFSD